MKNPASFRVMVATWCTLTLTLASSSEAFHLNSWRSSRASGSVCLSVAAASTNRLNDMETDDNGKNRELVHYKDLHEANMALDRLAVKCADLHEPIITRADECQSQWELLKEQGDTIGIVPDTISFNTVLKAWTKCCHSLAEYKRHSDTVTHSITTTTTSNSHHEHVYTPKDAAERVTRLLLSQEKLYESGVIPENARPDSFSYNNAIDAWAKSGVPTAPHNAEKLLKRMIDHEYINPDSLSYNGVLDAWSYSGKPESIQKVEQIWQRMEQLYADKDEQTNSIKPTIRTINSIIHAYGKRVQELIENKDIDDAIDKAQEAEGYLNLMKERYEQTKDPDHLPDVMTYTSLIDCYGRCGRYQTTQRAKALLEELKHASRKDPKNRSLRPNYRTYTSLIGAWSRTRSPVSPAQAEELLMELLKSKERDLQPNARTFTAVIQCWARSRDVTKPQKALRILKTMKEWAEQDPARRSDIRPSLVTYNAVLDACARCGAGVVGGDDAGEKQMDALKIAFAVFKTMQKEPYIVPNQSTYSTLLRVAAYLLPPGDERNNVASAVFDKARKAGMVNDIVLTNLRKSVDHDVACRLLAELGDDHGNLSMSMDKIPPNWSRNLNN